MWAAEISRFLYAVNLLEKNSTCVQRQLAEVKTTSPGWRIQSPQGPRWITVNTAIRYVLETRDNVQDPAIKKNADLTLAKLLHFHKADNKAP
jgi:hypothetical protein